MVFDFGTKGGIVVLICLFVVFHNRLLVLSAQSDIGMEKCPDTGIVTDFYKHIHSEAYGEIVLCFSCLLKDKILQLFISRDDSRRVESFSLYVFDIRYQKVSEPSKF